VWRILQRSDAQKYYASYTTYTLHVTYTGSCTEGTVST
jgi:hypothetical protein